MLLNRPFCAGKRCKNSWSQDTRDEAMRPLIFPKSKLKYHVASFTLLYTAKSSL
jgi:hypothetical protein